MRLAGSFKEISSPFLHCLYASLFFSNPSSCFLVLAIDYVEFDYAYLNNNHNLECVLFYFSWYPKKPDVESMQSGSKEFSPPPVHPHHMSSSKFKRDKDKEEEEKLRHQLEIAKTMVMDLPQPRSPAHSLGSHTPSPKPSPSRGKSSLVRSKKACSSSPADREGYYPCNRCGR